MKTFISVRFATTRWKRAVRKSLSHYSHIRDVASEPLFVGAPTETPFAHHKFMKTKSILASLAATLCAASTLAAPLGTAFTYQGRLTDNGQPANGSYDILFSMMDAATNGIEIGPVLPMPGVTVRDGYFTVQLDFGVNAFTGGARWLDIGVRTNCNCLANYTLLSPRQPLTPAPYAQFAANAAAAATATSAATATTASSVAWSNITEMPAGFADGVDNDTTYTAGPGLSLGGVSNQFSVNFAGSGVGNTAARSDHSHFGSYWSGTSSGVGLSVMNNSLTGSGIYAQQGTGSGASVPFGYTAASWAETSQGDAVYGATGYALGTGVYGYASNPGGATFGVYGRSDSPSGVGVFARGSGTTGTALKLSNGAIRVAGAGTNSSTPAFVHVVTPSNLATNLGLVYSIINNPYCNNDPNALLFVTPNGGKLMDFSYGPSVLLFYDDGADGFATNRWYLLGDSSQVFVGNKYNVLVVKP
jgi:hypothetical protein